jgi:hypothetical protein
MALLCRPRVPEIKIKSYPHSLCHTRRGLETLPGHPRDRRQLHRAPRRPAHVIATQNHLTGAREPPEPSYAPSFHQPATTGSSPKKPSSPAACCVHTPSELIAACYLTLLRDGASGSCAAIPRGLHPAALVALDFAVRVHQSVAPQFHARRAPASCASCARVWWCRLAVAGEQMGAFWGVVGEVFGGRGER